jgi:DNA-binding response OmpR family regulator
VERLNLISMKYEDNIDSNTSVVRISRIRKKMGFTVIKTYRHLGYALSYDGCALVKEALDG